MPKTALVISGGGSRGAFAIGAAEHLIDVEGLQFDIVAGTSTGSLIAPLVVTDEIVHAKNVYTNVSTRDVILKRPLAEVFLQHDAIYDATPLKGLVEREILGARAQQVFASATQMFVTTVNLNNGKTVFFQTGPPAVNTDPLTRLLRITDERELTRAMRASAHEPVFMPPVEVRPDSSPDAYRTDGIEPGTAIKPTDRYVDGGVREIAPIKIAIDNGATDIYAVVLSMRDPRRKERTYDDALDILLRTIDLFTQEITKRDVTTAQRFNQGARYLDALKQEFEHFGLTREAIDQVFAAVDEDNPFRGTRVVNLFLIRPKRKLPGSGLEFRPAEMAKMVLRGRKRAQEALAQGPTLVPLIA